LKASIFPPQKGVDGDDRWGWELRDETGNLQGFGLAATRTSAVEEISRAHFEHYGIDLISRCECGGRKIGMKPFEPGHSHWCQLSPFNCEMK